MNIVSVAQVFPRGGVGRLAASVGTDQILLLLPRQGEACYENKQVQARVASCCADTSSVLVGRDAVWLVVPGGSCGAATLCLPLWSWNK